MMASLRKGRNVVLRDQSYFTYRTPHGLITIGVCDGFITAIALGIVKMPGENRACELSNLCATQLLEYFAGRRTAFDLPLKPQGSEFQNKVWSALQRIPYGQTRTTAEIAEAIDCPESYRMVGIAIRKNPIIILIPAHRIVGANGKVPGTDKQAQRRAAFLELERRFA